MIPESFIRTINDVDALARAWHPPLVPVDTDWPRLVTADWLEENGHVERAEFIRVQIALAKVGCLCCCPDGDIQLDYACDCQERAEPLRRREWELLQKNVGDG